jgi:hypothetical protein
MAGEVRPVTVTIENGSATSDAFSLLPGENIVAVITPSAWTAADIGLDYSPDGTTWYPMIDGNRGLSGTTRMRIINVTTGSYMLAGESFDVQVGAGYFRLVSISTADDTTVDQEDLRTLTVLLGKRH